MADTYSFDLGSKVDLQELENAIQQTLKEVANRYDLKDADAALEYKSSDSKLHLSAADDYKVQQVYDIFKQKLVKRNISTKVLTPGPIKSALGGTAKQEIELQNGISKEKAKDIIKDIKDSGLKVQTQIQDTQIRVTAKKIDDLQAIIALVRGKDYGIDVQALNYR